jgi:hypothetical protein
MVKAEITRFLGNARDGKRRHIYRVSIVGDRAEAHHTPEDYAAAKDARNYAATRLRSFSHVATIVEQWTDGRVYRVTSGGKPELVRGVEKVAEEKTMVCTGCNERKNWSECNGYGECRACSTARVEKQRKASGLASDYGEEAVKALDLAVSSFPETFGLRRFPGTFKIDRARSYVSEGSIQLLVVGLNADGSWRDLSRGTIAELQKQIVRKAAAK